jgi:uncharacterized membrane protein
VIVSQYFIAFISFSFFGWIYECIYCTIVDRRWQNRGFLFGPICPIYGISVVLSMIVFGHMHIPGISYDTPAWKIFIICALMSAVIEYFTSYTLERIFHAVWWDYSKLPFNLQGRISLFTSLGFGFGGLLVVYVIAPFVESQVNQFQPLMIELFSLILLSLLIADLTLTVTVLHHFDQFVVEAQDEFNHNMSSIVEGTVRRTSQLKTDIGETKHSLKKRFESMGGYFHGTLRRVSNFKDKNESMESARKSLLSFIK